MANKCVLTKQPGKGSETKKGDSLAWRMHSVLRSKHDSTK